MFFSVKFFPVVLFSLSFCSVLFAAEPNLIVNGNFESDSGWNDLGLYNDGSAESTVEGNAYMIAIDNPGTELWSVQLTQSDIPLRNGAAYILKFDISASLERTIEVTISRNGGDWMSYSGKDTISISPTRYSYEKQFIMKEASDNAARIEFNCGKGEGTIAVRNVQLYEFTEKILELENPNPDEQITAGVPYEVAWTAVNISGQLVIQLSENNGTTWKSIDTVAPNSSPYQWTPDAVFTPWCRMRILSTDSPSVQSVSEGTFEIIPINELLKNGSFTNGDMHWNIGVHSGNVESEITGYGGYQIMVYESGSEDWNIQLTQDNVRLEAGKKYRYSFIGFSDSSSTIDVNVGMSGDPYTSYIDTNDRFITLTPVPVRYSLVFTMNAPTDSNARFEVNCGKATGNLYFDDFSLIAEYVAPVKRTADRSMVGFESLSDRSGGKIVNCRNSDGAALRFRSRRVFDLKGRVLSSMISRTSHGNGRKNVQHLPAGIYLIEKSIKR